MQLLTIFTILNEKKLLLRKRGASILKLQFVPLNFLFYANFREY